MGDFAKYECFQTELGAATVGWVLQQQTSPLSPQHEADACTEPHRTCSGQYDGQESRKLFQFTLIPASVSHG